MKEKEFETMIAGKPTIWKIDDEAIATSVFMDDNFLFVGDSNGVVSLRERKNGSLLYTLNK